MDIRSEIPHARKPKRIQVIRACNSCRQHRIKCDNKIPCSSCRSKNTTCTNASIKHMTPPQAFREIERLRLKVHELEVELEQQRRDTNDAHDRHSRPRASVNTVKRPSLTAVESQDGDPQSIWEGIYIRTARSASKTWYGASSLFYFIGRMSGFLGSAYSHIPPSGQLLDLNSATTLLDQSSTMAINTTGSQLSQQTNAISQNIATERCSLRPIEEEYFLDFYWNSYHTALFPIINEAEFKEYYRSLYISGGNVRKPSALVDILLALSMQLAISQLPATRQPPKLDNKADATVAGRWYYLRCQKLLAYELESPTIATLQCQLLCAVYLCCGTFQNMADSACSTAVRTAYMLGIHQDPPANMLQQEREIRKRLWWALFIFDSKFGMKLGRPFLIHQSDISPGLPDHSLQAAAISGSSFAALGDHITWLSFNVDMSKLFLTVRTVYAAVFSKGSTPYSTQPTLEAHAWSVKAFLSKLQQWTKSVPGALLLKRKDIGDPLSTNVSELELEGFEPLWLKRQRLILELMFHNLCTSLYRPFISFDSVRTSAVVEQHAKQCARHGMALTRIIYQVLSKTTMLAGWHEVFQWQWNAAMTLVGFILAYPQGVFAEEAFECIELSVEIFDIFGRSFAVATSAAGIVRKLSNTIRLSMSRDARSWRAVTSRDDSAVEIHTATESAVVTPVGHGFMLDDISTTQLQDAFGLAFDVDQWTNLDSLWPAIYDETLGM